MSKSRKKITTKPRRITFILDGAGFVERIYSCCSAMTQAIQSGHIFRSENRFLIQDSSGEKLTHCPFCHKPIQLICKRRKRAAE